GNDRIIIDGRQRHVIGYLEEFLFSPDRSRQPVSSLSGGERNRLLLARLLTRPSNVLVLDEPTNDLDMETLELLEAILLDYSGTVLVVSHDRQFLDNLCTSTLVFEEGEVREYVGGYSDWRRCAEALNPAESGTKKPGAAKKPVGKKKLSNRERERWQKLPGLIEALEAELEALHQTMNDPAFYRGDEETIRKTSERAQTLPVDIEQAYDEWSELDERT
ncbi:MAG: ATP-binding cassette domain-containing protein, partial [Verrucomicrobiota bacterium]